MLRFDTFYCCTPKIVCACVLFFVSFCVNWFWLLSNASIERRRKYSINAFHGNHREYVPSLWCWSMSKIAVILPYGSVCTVFLCNQIFCEIQYFVCFGFVDVFLTFFTDFTFYFCYCWFLDFNSNANGSVIQTNSPTAASNELHFQPVNYFLLHSNIVEKWTLNSLSVLSIKLSHKSRITQCKRATRYKLQTTDLWIVQQLAVSS